MHSPVSWQLGAGGFGAGGVGGAGAKAPLIALAAFFASSSVSLRVLTASANVAGFFSAFCGSVARCIAHPESYGCTGIKVAR